MLVLACEQLQTCERCHLEFSLRLHRAKQSEALHTVSDISCVRQALALVLPLTLHHLCSVSVVCGMLTVPVSLQVQHNYQKQDQLFHMVMHLPAALAAVSPAVQDILGSEFGRHPVLLPNSVDCERFFPGPVTLQAPSAILVAPARQVGLHAPSSP